MCQNWPLVLCFFVFFRVAPSTRCQACAHCGFPLWHVTFMRHLYIFHFSQHPRAGGRQAPLPLCWELRGHSRSQQLKNWPEVPRSLLPTPGLLLSLGATDLRRAQISIRAAFTFWWPIKPLFLWDSKVLCLLYKVWDMDNMKISIRTFPLRNPRCLDSAAGPRDCLHLMCAQGAGRLPAVGFLVGAP